MGKFIPFLMGLAIAALLYTTIHWWGFLVLFPWIGFSITLGIIIASRLPKEKQDTGRRIAMLMILPSLLFFVPIVNNENFQMEGIVLLLAIGLFTKGVIHYAIAKVFGPLIWGRGFCSWACWTGAVLEWLPVKKEGRIPPELKNFRFLPLTLSVLLPLVLIFGFSFDVRRDYLYHAEMIWMFAGNILYYLLAIPMAFIFRDQRAFCKIFCPVALVMKIPTRWSRIKRRPSGNPCIQCGACNRGCPMDVDVMRCISRNERVRDTECINCGRCRRLCPVGAIR